VKYFSVASAELAYGPGMFARALAVAALSAALLVPAAQAATPTRLKAFSSCQSIIKYGNRYASRAGVPMRATPVTPMPMFVSSPQQEGTAGGSPQPAAAPAAPTSDAKSGAGTDFSGTNVQEEGVDEPDIVKTDGKTLFSVAGNRLHAIDVSGSAATLADSLDLGANGYGAQLLLHEGRLLVMQTRFVDMPTAGPDVARPASSPAIYGGEQSTVISEVDIRDPKALKVARTLTVDGSLLTARLNGATARVVVNTLPRLAPQPVEGPGPAPAARAAATGKRAQRWLPHGTLRSRSGKKSRRAMVACKAVRQTPTFAGIGMLTILTIDLEKGLPAVDSDSIMTDAETVYASGGTLYAATRKWARPDMPEGEAPEPDEVSTQLHAFDISEPGKTTYRASGRVRGYLLSQFSLSEHKGVLRVASTTTPTWWGPGQDRSSESFVTTFKELSGKLVQAGQVGGLGKGERIYAVRFIDDVGYVVTFRQVDPLYTVDVSDATRPAVLGELKVAGYSAYLHPIGDGLLLGVGQDASEEGFRQGAQLSVFDVKDPRSPARLHQVRLGDGASTEAEYDHHAFLYWGASKLAVVPVQIYDRDGGNPFVGAIGFRADRAQLSEAGRIQHPTSASLGQIRRSVVIKSRLYTVSDAGIKASDLNALGDVGWLAFPSQ
jgi:uncharacterized secreted protein with C-terminal beta-propeller domain